MLDIKLEVIKHKSLMEIVSYGKMKLPDFAFVKINSNQMVVTMGQNNSLVCYTKGQHKVELSTGNVDVTNATGALDGDRDAFVHYFFFARCAQQDESEYAW